MGACGSGICSVVQADLLLCLETLLPIPDTKNVWRGRQLEMPGAMYLV